MPGAFILRDVEPFPYSTNLQGDRQYVEIALAM